MTIKVIVKKIECWNAVWLGSGTPTKDDNWYIFFGKKGYRLIWSQKLLGSLKRSPEYDNKSIKIGREISIPNKQNKR